MNKKVIVSRQMAQIMLTSEENSLPKHRDYKEKLNVTKSSDMPNSRCSGAD